jgi:hypothetical protein
MSEHWLQHAHGRIVAGDSEPDVLADYGWVQITDEEREAVEAAEAYMAAAGCRNTNVQKTLRGLLERLK